MNASFSEEVKIGTLDHIIKDADRCQFEESFNRVSFPFAHYLSEHPLFALDRLVELAHTQADEDVYFDAGNIAVNQRWDQSPKGRLSVTQTIDQIENAGAWVLLKRLQRDPRYAAILESGLAEVESLVGANFPKKIQRKSVVVLITSPNRTTAYHIDPDCNFLIQIRGEKVLYVFDQYDREVLPEQELERFWTLDNNAAIYKEQFQARARAYEMKPGMGVHMPVNAPHWAKNGDNISVSVALIFQMPDWDLANIYRWNHYLRKIGLDPTPPGQSRLRDAMKRWSMEGASRARRTLKRLVGKGN